MTVPEPPVAQDGGADVVIVGGGHAGAAAAIALRQNGFGGSVLMLCGEAAAPYERPPLSKSYLAGEVAAERLSLRAATFWPDKGIALALDSPVAAVDAAARRVTTAAGRSFGYGALIWAAGGAARRLDCPGGDLAGVHVVRSLADVDAIRAELPDVRELVVIGGGYIGLEVAAVLTSAGKQVTLCEALPRVLARVAGPLIADFYTAEHRAAGVTIHLNAAAATIHGTAGRVSAVELADGRRIPAQMVIAGIGIVPASEPLVAAGAAAGPAGVGGVAVDAACRTSLGDIYAIGDLAAQANPFAAGAVIRVESVQNAHDQALIVARHLTGQPLPLPTVPWFWSNQYDLKLQSVGLASGHDLAVRRGDPATRSFSVVYLRGGRVIALDCVNMVRDYVQGRKLIEAGIAVDAAAIADPAVPLKSWVAGTMALDRGDRPE